MQTNPLRAAIRLEITRKEINFEQDIAKTSRTRQLMSYGGVFLAVSAVIYSMSM